MIRKVVYKKAVVAASSVFNSKRIEKLDISIGILDCSFKVAGEVQVYVPNVIRKLWPYPAFKLFQKPDSHIKNLSLLHHGVFFIITFTGRDDESERWGWNDID